MKKKIEVVMINEKDGYATCDESELIETLELLTGKKLDFTKVRTKDGDKK